ncbi:hypothetical protein CYMTET_36048, partial [Cymbomonas tetramitiformis]
MLLKLELVAIATTAAAAFDRIVAVERPDKQGREEILRVHINNRGLPLAAEVSLEGIAKGTIGFT